MNSSKGIGGHHRAYRGKTDDWLTPPEILHALGDFDLDPCAPRPRPWDTAKKHYTADDDGLFQEWEGRVWLNPPYGPQTGEWLDKLAKHGDGVALIFARTETKTFFKYVWGKAHTLLFIRGRLTFYTIDGKLANANSGGPSVLVAYGRENHLSLLKAAAGPIDGKIVLL